MRLTIFNPFARPLALLSLFLMTSCFEEMSYNYVVDLRLWNHSEERIFFSAQSEADFNITKVSLSINESCLLYRIESETPIVDESAYLSVQYNQFLDAFMEECPGTEIIIRTAMPKEETKMKEPVVMDFSTCKVNIMSEQRLRKRNLRENRTVVALIFEGF